MASAKGAVSWVWHLVWMSLWLLVILAIAFFVLFLLQRQPVGLIQKGATVLGNAAKGQEVHS
jgi:hypothetical protein